MYYLRHYKRENLYNLDFCWVICHAYMIYAAIVFYATVYEDENWKEFVSDKRVFYCYWGLANGPLAGAVLFLKNALVLHEMENVVFCFIHLTPPVVTWTMRWYVEDI